MMFRIDDRWLFDPTVPELRDGKKAIPLTLNEFRALSMLARARGAIVSRDQMTLGRRGMDSIVRALRKKLGADFPILTIYRGGYRLAECVEQEIV